MKTIRPNAGDQISWGDWMSYYPPPYANKNVCYKGWKKFSENNDLKIIALQRFPAEERYTVDSTSATSSDPDEINVPVDNKKNAFFGDVSSGCYLRQFFVVLC